MACTLSAISYNNWFSEAVTPTVLVLKVNPIKETANADKLTLFNQIIFAFNYVKFNLIGCFYFLISMTFAPPNINYQSISFSFLPMKV